MCWGLQAQALMTFSRFCHERSKAKPLTRVARKPNARASVRDVGREEGIRMSEMQT
jgi:hypothetical protein